MVLESISRQARSHEGCQEGRWAGDWEDSNSQSCHPSDKSRTRVTDQWHACSVQAIRYVYLEHALKRIADSYVGKEEYVAFRKLQRSMRAGVLWNCDSRLF